MTREEQKYKNLDEVLKDINAKTIALNEEEKYRNNVILRKFLDDIVENMNNNRIFNNLYRIRYYGGSYYDGLKVSKPDEYDLDLVFKLPTLTYPKLYTSDNFPGYVQIHLENVGGYERHYYAIPGFAKTFLDDEHFLSTKKVLKWMKSVVHIALNKFVSQQIYTEHGTFDVSTPSEGGPAFTVVLEGTVDEKQVKISVDLVPCFVFTDEDWPEPPFRQNEVPKWNEFLIVPKQPILSTTYDANLSRHWRLSFQRQEASLIKGLQNLKPALKLIKRIRDVYDHKCISSYYIKTIFLWEVQQNGALWDKHKPLSYILIAMLKRYKEALENRRIAYYWDKKNNLIAKPKPDTLDNFANKIRRVIRDIENFEENPDHVFGHFVKEVPTSATSAPDPYNEMIKNVKSEHSRCTIL